MGEAVAQARRQVDLTREALAADVERVEARVRAELDWKARLRRQGPELLAIVGGVVVIAVGAVVLRRMLRGDGEEEQAPAEVALDAVTLTDLAREIRALRAELEKPRSGKSGRGSLLRKLAVTAAGAAASAGGRMAAKRLVDSAEREPTERR